MAKELYLSLFRELNELRFESSETSDILSRLGAPAVAFRGYAYARRRAWGSARADFRGAMSDPEVDPLIAWVCGAGLFAARDYDHALDALRRAAANEHRGTNPRPDDEQGLGTRARKLALKLATSLGWSQEARELREAIAEHDIRGAKHLRAHSLELQRQAAIRRRAQQALEGPPDQAARRSYSLLFRDGPDAASAALDALLRRHPRHPEVLRARLRLDLLLDRLEAVEARVDELDADLRRALRAELAALALAWTDADRALELTCDAGDDARLLYLRGQAMRLLADDMSDAAELFEAARVRMPNSFAINLALAVTRYQQRPDAPDEGLEHRFDDLLDSAPGLLSDAAASASVELWADHGIPLEREPKAKILLRAHGMLTAERDLALSTYVRRGQDGRLHLRHVAPPGDGREPHLTKLHREDDELISHHEAVLVFSIGVSPPRPETPGDLPDEDDSDEVEIEPWTPRFLSPEQVEQFLSDGYIILRQAFDPQLAREWREDGIRRLRDEPEKWVRGYDPKDEAKSLANFDHTDPTTWNWSRIDLLGPQTFHIEEYAPDAWAAICDLLGGPGRVKTKTWGYYMLLNVRDDDPMVKDQPGPFSTSWHIDDPNPATRLDRIRNGLVAIALFDKLLPRSGNTWLALDSVAKVSRKLAAHPEGVDFVSDRGNQITGECERFIAMTGEAGDVLLMHPLMMHSASRNISGRIRWMANPMVYLKQPLDPFRPVEELSLVELAIRRAIDEDPEQRKRARARGRASAPQ